MEFAIISFPQRDIELHEDAKKMENVGDGIWLCRAIQVNGMLVVVIQMNTYSLMMIELCLQELFKWDPCMWC